MGIEKKYGINIGKLKKGKLNLITDVPGIKVGHCTLDNKDIKTGVTCILPHQGNIFKNKVLGATSVINGFGKSVGLVQVEELGTIETPILLTNTLSVGTVSSALVKYMLDNNEDIGKTTGTVNPLVLECNDGYLNNIRAMEIEANHVFKAIDNISDIFQEGSVGAGTGMSCYELKGGIGSSSRVIELEGKEYTIGTLVLSNCGLFNQLQINGKNISKNLENKNEELEKGSIIMIIATDIPLSERQLKRVANRASIGLIRTGSYLGNGSGDISIAFTTGNIIKHYEENDIIKIQAINENKIDLIFKGVGESIEESIVSSMLHSETTTGRDGHMRKSLKEYI